MWDIDKMSLFALKTFGRFPRKHPWWSQYFQIQFIRVCCTLHGRNSIRNSIKNRRKIMLWKGNTMVIQNHKKNMEEVNMRKILNWKKRERKTKKRKKFLSLKNLSTNKTRAVLFLHSISSLPVWTWCQTFPWWKI